MSAWAVVELAQFAAGPLRARAVHARGALVIAAALALLAHRHRDGLVDEAVAVRRRRADAVAGRRHGFRAQDDDGFASGDLGSAGWLYRLAASLAARKPGRAARRLRRVLSFRCLHGLRCFTLGEQVRAIESRCASRRSLAGISLAARLDGDADSGRCAQDRFFQHFLPLMRARLLTALEARAATIQEAQTIGRRAVAGQWFLASTR